MAENRRKNPKQVALTDDNEVLFVKVLGLHLEVEKERLSDKQFINMCFTKGVLKHREDLIEAKNRKE